MALPTEMTDTECEAPMSTELEAEIDAALEAARLAPPSPMVKSIEYLPSSRILLLRLKSGQRLPLPVEEVEELAGATDDQLTHYELLGSGTWVHFPDFDGNLDVPFLVAGGRGGPKWTQQLEEQRSTALLAA